MVLEEMEALEQELKDKVYQVIQKDLVVTVEESLLQGLVQGLVQELDKVDQTQEVNHLREGQEEAPVLEVEAVQELVNQVKEVSPQQGEQEVVQDLGVEVEQELVEVNQIQVVREVLEVREDVILGVK